MCKVNYLLYHKYIFKQYILSKNMPNEIEYLGKKRTYRTPLGFYEDGQETGRVHDRIIPKFHEIDPKKLVDHDREYIERLRRDTKRQLRELGPQSTRKVRLSLRNTIDFTEALLQSR